jgi:hypothetical protein
LALANGNAMWHWGLGFWAFWFCLSGWDHQNMGWDLRIWDRQNKKDRNMYITPKEFFCLLLLGLLRCLLSVLFQTLGSGARTRSEQNQNHREQQNSQCQCREPYLKVKTNEE